MCKTKFKLGTLAVLAGLLATGFFGWSYIRTAYHDLGHFAKSQVPLDFEIQRIRGELAQIDPDVKRNLSVLADETIEVQNLKQDISDCTARLEQQKRKILTMKGALESGDRTVALNDHEYSASRVREMLANAFDSYKVADEGVKTKEKLLEQKEKALAAHKDQLAQMHAVKEQLEVQLATLEAELQNVRLAETKSNVQFDDSRLSNIKASMKDLQDRINAMKVKQDLQAQFVNDPVLDVEQKTKTDNVTKDVDAYFGNTGKVAEQK